MDPPNRQKIAEVLVEIAGSQISPHVTWSILRVEQNIKKLPLCHSE